MESDRYRMKSHSTAILAAVLIGGATALFAISSGIKVLSGDQNLDLDSFFISVGLGSLAWQSHP